MIEIEVEDMNEGDVVLQVYSQPNHIDIIIGKFLRYHMETSFVECILISRTSRFYDEIHTLPNGVENSKIVLSALAIDIDQVSIAFFKLTEDETINALMEIL